MSIVAIVQARLNSARFPEKVLKKIDNQTIVQIINNKLKNSNQIDKIVFAIPKNSKEKKLYNHLKKLKMNIFRGNEKDVLDRYYKAAKENNAKIIVRITSDCPLIDSRLINKMISFFKKNRFDYISNTIVPTYPDGLDVEIFTFNSLKYAWNKAKAKLDREHVTKYLLESNSIKKYNIKNNKDFSNLRWTVDTKIDFKIVKMIYTKFKGQKKFNLEKAVNYCLKNKFFQKNNFLKRNYKLLTKSNLMWDRAKKFIPGGNLMISKNPNLFLPGKWPTYFQKTKGCYIWGLDGKKYIDLSIMGAGTNILGYSNNLVDKSVISNLKKGNLSTLNCPEEVELAERIININPWADKTLFARTGGEANAIAVRLARAYTGKDNIAVCGYHGWHDWYLAASKNNEKVMKKEHLPFYSSVGVPKSLRNSLLIFNYNNITSLKKLISTNKNIAAIKMEVIRNEKPKNNFLHEVKKIAMKNNIVLIFDECTTGFRETFGGIHQKYNVTPDIAIYGKSLGNGYPITCVVGKKDLMKMKEKTFMSSTFWTDRIGPTAALKTLDVMEKTKSWEIITEKGKKIQNFWELMSQKYKLDLKIKGIPALSNFEFKTHKHGILKTFITDEMLKQNFLANNVVYLSIAHSDEILKKYFEKIKNIFSKISQFNNDKKIEDYLSQNISAMSFRK